MLLNVIQYLRSDIFTFNFQTHTCNCSYEYCYSRIYFYDNGNCMNVPEMKIKIQSVHIALFVYQYA